MEKKEGAKCDPGWNDPPLFSYETQTAQLKASKPRTFLNKRVAFPLDGASPPTSSCMPVDPTAPLSMCNISNLPPPPMGPFTPPKEMPMRNEKCVEHENTFDPSQSLKMAMTNLFDILDETFQDEEKDKAEIQRRLDILRKMWNDDKLCKDVQQKILALSQALKNNEVEKADELQKCLMVDHAASCSPWMSGVRQLIHHQESSNRSDEVPPAIDQESLMNNQDISSANQEASETL